MSFNQQISIYSILDAARIFGEIETAQTLQSNFLSLYMGKNEEMLSSVAPYLFQYQSGSEFGKWLLEKRLNYSLLLLRNHQKTINEVVFECGFESVSHFSRAFKARFDLTPSSFKKENR